MNFLDWEEVSMKLDNILKEIFNKKDLDSFSTMEKREKIYNYMVSTISFDYELWEKIKISKTSLNNKTPRNSALEIKNILDNKKGICSAISHVYKLLLEKVDIYAICVITDNEQLAAHELVLVEENNDFSFDDITSALFDKSKKWFNYDLKDAYDQNQGKKEIMDNKKWVALPTTFVYNVVGRTDNNHEKITEYKEDVQTFKLPDNILKANQKKEFI